MLLIQKGIYTKPRIAWHIFLRKVIKQFYIFF